MEVVTFALPEQKLQGLLTLLAILATQHCIGQKELKRLVGKLRSMHPTVPGVVAHLCHIQRDLAQGRVDRNYLPSAFQREIADWRVLVVQIAARSTHLADIVCQDPTHLGFCKAVGLGDGGMWLYPLRSSHSLVWRHPWPLDIINNLVLATNSERQITNSDLELAYLVLHKATLLVAVPAARMDVPRSGSYNTSTVFWSTREASTINPVIVDLLFIHALHSIHFSLNPYISYHPDAGH